jgi:hypothetical protein
MREASRPRGTGSIVYCASSQIIWWELGLGQLRSLKLQGHAWGWLHVAYSLCILVWPCTHRMPLPPSTVSCLLSMHVRGCSDDGGTARHGRPRLPSVALPPNPPRSLHGQWFCAAKFGHFGHRIVFLSHNKSELTNKNNMLNKEHLYITKLVKIYFKFIVTVLIFISLSRFTIKIYNNI